jgi:CRISPR-associated endonuclease/helicase Cas3
MILDDAFKALTDHSPFPWQVELFKKFARGEIPPSCNLPTGLGKTNVIAIWLIALAYGEYKLPRRLVYVMNRRTVVDQATHEVEKLRENLGKAGLSEPLSQLCAIAHDTPLAISTLRGQFADNGEWCADPARPAIIIGTVDMIGSRLLFSGYGLGFRRKPLHAGFLAQDTLLIHDEAHLEPAFQELLVAIHREQQRCKELGTFRVLELSATSRGTTEPFGLTTEERNPPEIVPDPPAEPIHHVWRRLTAKKKVYLHKNVDQKKLSDEITQLALKYKESKEAVLVFVQKVEDVEKTGARLKKEKQKCQQLTGTLRGLERDALVRDPIFARFLPPSNRPDGMTSTEGTVYLVCTSAGEVGVDISGDHLVCDLSTFESMAQRFGRVNRFGDRDDTEIHVVYPNDFDDKDELDCCRKLTLALLKRLNSDGSPAALGRLSATERFAAFAPTPGVPPTTDILFDSWAMTTIRGKLPGRPPVERYLHGIRDWELPETYVAWREEVGIIKGHLLERYKPENLLADYPLKPHELLRDRSDRVLKHLLTIAERYPDYPLWLLYDEDYIEVLTLRELADRDKKNRINYRTVLLSPSVGGLQDGLLKGESEDADDIADEWYENTKKQVRRRIRVWGDDPQFNNKTRGMRLIRRIDLLPDQQDEDAPGPSWHWFERPGNADNEGSKSGQEHIPWQDHTDDVARNATQIARALKLPSELREALRLAAKFHDLGKKREIWQRSIGNPEPKNWLAKSGRTMKPVDLTDYRHEFGSLLDIQGEDEFQIQPDEVKDLILHLIAAHHGWARPHFEPAAYDPPPTTTASNEEMAVEVIRRFGRLQQRFGRWGLAYLESLLRAADYAASANPSAALKEKA